MIDAQTLLRKSVELLTACGRNLIGFRAPSIQLHARKEIKVCALASDCSMNSQAEISGLVVEVVDISMTIYGMNLLIDSRDTPRLLTPNTSAVFCGCDPMVVFQWPAEGEPKLAVKDAAGMAMAV